MSKPDYGVDAPGVIRNLLIGGGAAIGAGLWMRFGPFSSLHGLGVMLLWMGPWALAAGVLMLLYAKRGKYRHRERMLRCVPWRGDERVLDVGTGRGLLLIGAAKRLRPIGKAYGIDIWSTRDLSGNAKTATLHNARREGVADRLELRSEDARKMGFPDDSFDVVLSNLCIHHIGGADGRRAACEEIVRVLKPGGIAVISDSKHTGEYRRAFESEGLTVTRSRPFFLDTFPPLTIVTAVKPKDVA